MSDLDPTQPVHCVDPMRMGPVGHCGAPVLRPFNAVQLDPVPVDQGTPGAMSLGFLGGYLWASSGIEGQPQHELHRHQFDGA